MQNTYESRPGETRLSLIMVDACTLVDRIKLSLCTFNIITIMEGREESKGVKVNGTNGVFHFGRN